MCGLLCVFPPAVDLLLHSGAMKSLKYPVLLCLLWLISAAAHAQLGDLYAAEVPVVDDTQEVRNQGLSQALQQVMVRLSGSADVAGHPAAGDVLRRAGSLVQQYRYRLDDALPPQRYLWAKFDKGAVDRLLRQAGIPVWGATRPRVLLWLAIEQGSARRLLNLENMPETRSAVIAKAAARGMPLQLPLMDLQDQAALSAADIWADYEAAIREASARYPHDVILTGRLRESGSGAWSADWGLWERGEQETFTLRGLALESALLSGIDGTQNRLAARYVPAVGSAGPEALTVRFTGIDSLQAYGRLLQILHGQESITRFDLRQVEGDTLLIELWVRGGRSALARVLSLGGELFLQPQQALPDAMPEAAGQETEAPQAVDMTFSYLHANG